MPSYFNYIPARDTDYDTWLLNFSTLITASPGTYGLVAGDATAIAAQYTAWHGAYLLGGGTYHAPVNPATKTPVTTAAKQTARTNSLAVVRPYAVEISLNAGVSSSDKTAVGVNPRTTTPTPIPTPTTFPLISVRLMTPLSVLLQYVDSGAGTGKAKPPGAIACEMRAEVSATPIVDPEAIGYIQPVTKSPYTLAFEPDDGGKTVYITGRWVTRTGKQGPWASIVTATVPTVA